MLTDCHCHLDHHYYAKDLDKVIERARKAGVKAVITNGIDYETNLISLQLAEKYGIVRPALGFYPPDALNRELYFEGIEHKTEKTFKDVLKQIEKNKDTIIALGEIGLDLYHGKDIESQKKVLFQLINLAVKLDKPVILHSRKAEAEILNLLEQTKINPQRVVLHCFSGRKSEIKRAIEKGYNFSIPTNIGRAENFKYLAEVCPISRILTETDGPYLSPYKNEDNSFNRNEPAYVRESVKEIAKLKSLSEEKVEKQLYDNYLRVFGK